MIGQRFILVPPYTEDAALLLEWFDEMQPAGVILFAGHFKDRKKVRQLCTLFKERAAFLNIPEPFITMDWEGGIVSRANEEGGFHSIPSPWRLAQAGVECCYEAALLAGAQMQAIGVTINFAPSLDLFGSPILATRCFSSDPQEVALYGEAFAKGLLAMGVMPVVKHFPGLGDGTCDTHLEQLQVVIDEEKLDAITAPFFTVLGHCSPIAVLVTHAIYPQFGPLPLTRTKRVIELLKEHNPEALFLTDDCSMEAVLAGSSRQTAIQEALDAGYDLVILSLPWEEQRQLLSTLTVDPQQHEDSLAKRQRMQAQLKTMAHPFLAEEAAAAQCLVQRTFQSAPPFLLEKPILLTIDLTKIRPEPWFIKENRSFLAQQLQACGVDIEQEVILDGCKKESCEQLKKLLPTLAGKTLLLQTFFYAGGPWNAIEKEWLSLLEPYQEKLLILSLGHPSEQEFLPKATFFPLGSFSKPILQRAAELLTLPCPTVGLDILLKNPDKYLAGKRFGLLCHRCSVDAQGRFAPDLLQPLGLKALFTPEHGLLGTHEAFASIDSQATSRWGCPLYSLHGSTRQPTEEILSHLDLLLIDLQDVGVRCYTYLSTLLLTLEACEKAKVEVLVLDRPNPLAHWPAQGPMLETGYESFVGKASIPFLHGKTLGSLAVERFPLTQVLSGNKASASFQTSPFIPPSPNLPSLTHLIAYPLTVFIEGTNYSEGRGTPLPFLQFGAPWVDKEALSQALQGRGLFFEPTSFIPRSIPGVAASPKFQNQLCHGVKIHLLNPKEVDPMTTAKQILITLFTLYPEHSAWVKWGKFYAIDLLTGSDQWRKTVEKLATQDSPV